jgi:hypothetical protein
VTEQRVRWVEPPAFLLAIAGLIALVGIGMTAAGSQKGGLFTDDPGHALRLTHYLDNGLYIRDFEVRRTTDGDVPDGAYVYGPATLLLTHEVNRALNDEEPDKAGMWPYQYRVRHGVVAAIGLAGLLAAVGLAWSVLGSWRWGVVTAGLLSAIPLWTGHAMFNPKDVPVAAAHTAFTLGLVLLAASKPTSKLRWLLFGGAILAGGTFLALGTRPGTWAPMSVVLAVFVLAVIRSRPVQTRASLVRIGATTLASLAVAYGGLLAIYPRVFLNPIDMMRVSASSSADYVSFGGQPRSDRSYVFVHLLTDMPLGILALMLVGTVAVVWMLVIQRRRSPQVDGMALVGAQAYAILVAAVLLDTSLYNGLRQLLFAFPALAVLATVGLAALMTALAGRSLVQSLLTIAAGLALILPTAVQVAMFPYQYSYINVAAEQFGVQAEDDYFGTSFREFADQAPQTVKVTCPFQRFGGVVYRTEPDCRTREQGTLSTYWKGRKALDKPKAGEFYALLRGPRPTPPNCEFFSEVRRWRNLESAPMSKMFKCHRPTDAQIVASVKMRLKERERMGSTDPEKIPKDLGLPPTYNAAPPVTVSPVLAYLTERGQALDTGNVEGAVRVHSDEDFALLSETAPDFQAFIQGLVNKRADEVTARFKERGTSQDSLGCTYRVDISVSGVTPDLATGRDWGCGLGQARKVIWVRDNGTWKSALRAKGGFQCADLKHYRVPAKIADATCWSSDGWAIRYRGPAT